MTKQNFVKAVQEISIRSFNETLKGKISLETLYDQVYKKYATSTKHNVDSTN